MKRPLSLFGLTGLLALPLALAGCGSSGTYAGYTEYRAPPVKTEAEIRQEEVANLERSRSKRGRIVDTGGRGILLGE